MLMDGDNDIDTTYAVTEWVLVPLRVATFRGT